jgi:hypothetical protein
MRLILLCLTLANGFCQSGSLQDFSAEFWRWRAANQPFSGDDIPRIERPPGYVPDWSAAAIYRRQREFPAFYQEWKQLDSLNYDIHERVDYRLLGSALSRVRWELEFCPAWQRDPQFYISQTLGALLEARLSGLSDRAILESIPKTLANAKKNLTDLRAPFAALAIEQLKDIRTHLDDEKAVAALEDFRAWLQQQHGSPNASVGREAYLFFLKQVALLPYTPEEMLQISRQELDRSVAFETMERNRNAGIPELPLFPNSRAQIERLQHDEIGVRRFLTEHHILTVPDWMPHYRYEPVRPELQALSGFSEMDIFLKAEGIRYIEPPSLKLGYFARSMAQDPRADMVHEGVPGHYFQIALSWAHEDAVRRHYYDSSANEGLGFYTEEMMLQAGYFDDSPRTREMIYNYARLRALRVEVDVKLATGQFTIAQAADYLQRTVPMDAATANSEAAEFASAPGQAISYQIGKTQILHFLSRSRLQQGDVFRLQDFHDFLWKNGNVPIALQEEEYLWHP